MRHSRRVILVLTLLLAVPLTVLAQENGTILPLLPGSIAFVGVDQNVYTLHLQDGRQVALTSDSSRTRVYRWPTWSTDGRLAYFLTDRIGNRAATEIFISPDGIAPGAPVYSGENELFNYAYWSPRNCVESDRCRDLAVLLSSDVVGGLFVALVRDGLDTPSSRLAGVGAPFYFTWSPDGGRMLWQRDQARLDLYDATTDDIITQLAAQPGAFQAPDWSPIDDRLLVGALNPDSQTTDIVILADGESRLLASRQRGPVAFAWSPNGNAVAYTDRDGPLVVIDSRTGDTLARSPVSGVLAFFWSPDSRSLAYITLSTPPGSFNASAAQAGKLAAMRQQDATGIAWSVLDVESGTNRRYGAFLPTQEMVYMLVYFDQFAKSHRLWSPDSRYLIYAEITPDNRAIISLLDTSQPNTVPFSIADGLIGIWSFQ